MLLSKNLARRSICKIPGFGSALYPWVLIITFNSPDSRRYQKTGAFFLSSFPSYEVHRIWDIHWSNITKPSCTLFLTTTTKKTCKEHIWLAEKPALHADSRGSQPWLSVAILGLLWKYQRWGCETSLRVFRAKPQQPLQPSVPPLNCTEWIPRLVLVSFTGDHLKEDVSSINEKALD